MKIAIIGAGFFGSTIAIKLSKSHSVDLYEKKKMIFLIMPQKLINLDFI